MMVLAVWGDHPESFQPGTRWPLDSPSMSAEVLRTGRPARVEDYTALPGPWPLKRARVGSTRSRGAPIVVDGRVWGVISTSSPEAPLPNHLEDRLAEFTELVATAIANSQAREELARLAEEQTALRRGGDARGGGRAPGQSVRSGERRGRSAGSGGGRRTYPLRDRWHGYRARRLDQHRGATFMSGAMTASAEPIQPAAPDCSA
jgi:GAF domain-containing protein